MNKLDPFEKLLNAKLQENEVELSYDSWDTIENQLPPAPKSNFYYWLGAAIIIGSITTSIVLFNNNSEKTEENNFENNQSEEISKNEKKTSESDDKSNNSIINLNNEANNKAPNINESKSTDKLIYNTDNSDENKNTNINHKTIDDNDSDVNNNKDNVQTYGPWEFQEDKKENIEKISLTAEFTCSNNSICIDDVIQFNAIIQPNVNYHWDFDDGNNSDSPNLEYQYNEPGIYFVLLTVTSDSDPNNSIISSEYQIVVNDKPNTEIEITSIEENGIPFNQFSQIINNDIQSNIWDFGDGTRSTDNNPIHRYLHKGNYLVTLILTDLNDCSNTISRSIDIDKVFNLMAPNSFTPNGDGINDNFIPESLKIMDVEFTMTIYNKLGKRVYQSKNIDQPWDGINQNTGQKCQEGNYMWVVQLVNKEGETEQYKGAILLLN